MTAPLGYKLYELYFTELSPDLVVISESIPGFYKSCLLLQCLLSFSRTVEFLLCFCHFPSIIYAVSVKSVTLE